MKKIISTLFLFPVLFIQAQMSATLYMMPASAPCNSCFDFSANISGGTPPYTYKWTFAGPPSVSYTTQTVNHCLTHPIDSAHYIYFEAWDGAGNMLQWPLFTPPIAFSPITICMVTVDSTLGKNLIIWDQTTDPTVISYNIYKETTSAGIYAVIGNVRRNDFSTYTDLSSNPDQVAARYKLSMIDSCGNESFQSLATKTIHLTVSSGMQNTWNLNWDNAEGFPVVKFRIWRQYNSQPPVLIDSVQSSLNSYTDMNAPGGLLHYTLEAISTNVCNPSLKTNFSPINFYSSSFSNFVDNSAFLGLNEEYISENISVQPNPFSTTTVLRITNLNQLRMGEMQLKIVDLCGNEIYPTVIRNSDSFVISKENISPGIYFYKILDSEKTIAAGKLIAQ